MDWNGQKTGVFNSIRIVWVFFMILHHKVPYHNLMGFVLFCFVLSFWREGLVITLVRNMDKKERKANSIATVRLELILDVFSVSMREQNYLIKSSIF